MSWNFYNLDLTMNLAKRMLNSPRLANSLHSTRPIKTHSLYGQASRSSFSLHFSVLHRTTTFPSTNQNLFFSSKSDSIANLVLSKDWSEELEQKLLISNLKPAHENVVYILKKLDKYPLKAFKFFIWVTEINWFEPTSATYCLLLRILAGKNSMKEFWFTANRVKEQGFYIDEDIYRTVVMHFKSLKMTSDAIAFTKFYNRMIKNNVMDSVVREVVEIVMRSDWGNDVETRLIKMKFVISDEFVVRVLMELRRYPSKALKIFRWFVEGFNFVHSMVTYNAIVTVLGRYDSIEEFWSMFNEMKTKGYDLDIDTYVKISRRFQKNKMFEDAVKLYEHIMDGPYNPLVHECSKLLRAISATNKPDLDLVFRAVNKFEAAGNLLSKTGYDIIHRALISVGRFDEAEKIMETMRNTGYEPDNVTYGQLIYGLCKAGRLEEACKVLDVMEVNECVPDLKNWTTLIQGHCAAGEVDKALFCFSKMMEKNCEIDADILDVLVNGLLTKSRIADAYRLLVELVNRARLRPWQATYINLIQNLLGARKLKEALNLLHVMRKHNYPPFPEHFLQYISKFGTVEDALNFLKALSSKGYPPVSAYERVLQYFFQEGRHSEAKDLLYKCPLHIRKHQGICSLFGSVEGTSDTVP